MAQVPLILLIEDRKDDRDLFAMALVDSGLRAQLVTAADAAEAVLHLNRIGRHAEAVLPALIVLDLGLPGLQGKTLLQVIRMAYRSRHVPVVVLTGSNRPGDQEECAHWGISEFVIKPKSYADLVRMVADFVRHLPGEPAAAKTSRLARLPDDHRS